MAEELKPKPNRNYALHAPVPTIDQPETPKPKLTEPMPKKTETPKGPGLNMQVVDDLELADKVKNQISEPQEGETTSMRLFPDFKPEEQIDKSESTEPSSQAPAQNAAQQQEDIFDIEQIKGKKFKAVIGGEEKIVPIEELVKGYQTDQYLSQKGSKLYEERKALAEERQKLEQIRSQRDNVGREFDQPNYQNDELIQTMDKRLSMIEKNINHIAKASEQAVFETNRKMLISELKHEGAADIEEYLPKIQNYIVDLKDDRAVQFYDTVEGGKALYYMMKNKDLQERLKSIESKQSGQTVSKPPIVKIDIGSSAGSAGIDNQSAKLEEAILRAKRTRNTDDWNTVLRLKGVI